jgi:hypothetical protein
VSRGDRAHDRQTEPVVPVGGRGAVAAEPLERLEHPRELVRWNHGTRVGD